MSIKRPYLTLVTAAAAPTRGRIQRALSALMLFSSSVVLAACGTDNGDPATENIADGITLSSTSAGSSGTSAGPSSTTSGSSSVSASSSSAASTSSSVSGVTSATTSGASSVGGTGTTTIGGMSSTGGMSLNGIGGGMGMSTGGPNGTGGGTSATTATASSTASGAGGSGGGGDMRSAGCDSERQLQNGRRTIQSGGQNREYILRVPDDYDNTKPYRLIFAFHWRSGNAEQVANGGMGGSTEDPYYGLWDLAENSTIFVAPEGLNAGWGNEGNRDVDLTDAILEEVQNDLCIDTSRIFSTGFSFGGGMSYALACARADVFRGVALYAGAQLSGCEGGTTPIAYFHAHGVSDGVLDISIGRPLRDRYVEVNGCTPMNPPEPAENSGTHICTSYEGCADGYPVRWCAHGGDHNPTEKDAGQSESWVPGEAWAFISQF